MCFIIVTEQTGIFVSYTNGTVSRVFAISSSSKISAISRPVIIHYMDYWIFTKWEKDSNPTSNTLDPCILGQVNEDRQLVHTCEILVWSVREYSNSVSIEVSTDSAFWPIEVSPPPILLTQAYWITYLPILNRDKLVHAYCEILVWSVRKYSNRVPNEVSSNSVLIEVSTGKSAYWGIPTSATFDPCLLDKVFTHHR